MKPNLRKWIWPLLIILTAMIPGVEMSSAGKRIPGPKDRPFTGKYGVLVIAHRGFSGGAPENTFAAFQRAIELGCDMIELDVHLAKDGRVVVIHDPTLEKTTNGQGNVADYTLKELQQLDAGSKFGPQFAGEKIPELKEVLALAKGKVLVNIEIKGGSLGPHKLEEVTDKTLKEVQRAGMVSQVLFSSFYPAALERIARNHPHASIALLYHQPWNDLPEVTKKKPYALLNLRDQFLTQEKIARIHRGGMKVNVYTVNSEEEMEKFIRWGIDGIITNFPDRLIQILRRE
jgi:glycerophosphoryl diester phosphodiesterase